MVKYWGYARVSTENQSDNSIEYQLEYLKKRADELGYLFKPVSEKQSGSSIDNRKALLSIIEKAENGDCVGFFDNSRLGRNTFESLALVHDFFNKGVAVQIGGKYIDRNNPLDELYFTIDSAISTYYLKNQKQKSIVGIEQTKKNGEWIFTSRLFGYRLSLKGSIPDVEIDEKEAEIIRYIFEWYSQGQSILYITKKLNSKGFRTREGKEFNCSCVRRYIHKPIYKGYYKVKGAGRFKGQETINLIHSDLVKSKYYPPIIDENLWDKVQKSYNSVHRTHAIQFQHRYSGYELSGILKCFYCNQLGKSTGYVHSFHKYKNNSEKVNSNYINRVHLPGCIQTWQTFRANIIEMVFQHCFYLVFANNYELEHFIDQRKKSYEADTKEAENDIERIDELIKKIIVKEKNINKAIIDGYDPKTFLVESKKFEIEKNELEKEKNILLNSLRDREDDFENIVEQYSEESLIAFIKSDNPAQRRKKYIELITSAIIYNNQIIIRYANSKTFIIQLRKNRGRYVQSEFDIKVSYLGKEQYTIFYNYNENSFNLKNVKLHLKANIDKNDIFAQSIIKKYQNQIEDLKNRIDIYSQISVT